MPLTRLLLCIVCICTAISCNHGRHSMPGEQADSLTRVCDTLVYNLNVDSLRTNSLRLMELAGKDREAYLDAKSYWFTSFFNEKEYGKCTFLINDFLSKETDLDRFPDKKTTFIYTRSRCYQYMKAYEQAKSSFSEILHYDLQDRNSLKPAVLKQVALNLRISLWQYLNCCLLSGTGKDGIEEFERLGEKKNCLLSDSCTRTRLIFLGYLYVQNNKKNDAIKCVKEALAYPAPEASDLRYTEYIYMNVIYGLFPEYETQRVELLQKAFDLAAAKNDRRLIQWSMSLLGDHYLENNEYYKTYLLYQKALDMFKQSGDDYGESNAQIFLIQLYHRLGMKDKVKENLKLAYESAQKKDARVLLPLIASYEFTVKIDNPKTPRKELYGILNKGAVLAKEVQREDHIQYFDAYTQILRMQEPDSAAAAAEKLEVLYKGVLSNSSKARTIIEFYIGNYYLRNNRYREGRTWMKRAMEESPYLNSNVKSAYEALMDSYIRTGEYQALAELTPRYEAMRDSLDRLRQITATTASVIRYDTEKKVQENQLLATRLDAEKRRVQLFSVSLAAILALAAGLILLLRNRHKIVKLQRDLIGHQREQLQKLMDEMKRTVPPQITEPEEGLLDNLRTSFITPEQENSFRKLFSEMHPHFLYKLRKHIPGVTKSEELLAMFLLLKQSNEEIAGILGISADSVKKSRYRLRKKLGLVTEQSLEEKIGSFV